MRPNIGYTNARLVKNARNRLCLNTVRYCFAKNDTYDAQTRKHPLPFEQCNTE